MVAFWLFGAPLVHTVLCSFRSGGSHFGALVVDTVFAFTVGGGFSVLLVHIVIQRFRSYGFFVALSSWTWSVALFFMRWHLSGTLASTAFRLLANGFFKLHHLFWTPFILGMICWKFTLGLFIGVYFAF